MKGKRNIVGILIVLIFAISLCAFRYYHPTHFMYNDRFVIGNTQENIIERYGNFYGMCQDKDGEISCGIYMIHDNTPEMMMSYDDSLWYEIYFENDIAVEVKLRKGHIGG